MMPVFQLFGTRASGATVRETLHKRLRSFAGPILKTVSIFSAMPDGLAVLLAPARPRPVLVPVARRTGRVVPGRVAGAPRRPY